MDQKLIRKLIEAAMAQRQHSYAPYSGYRVGAALLARNGQIFTGCNIENASYTPTICAERTAFAKAVSEGVREFEGICVAGGSGEDPDDFSMPCGVCRQTMQEFCGPDFSVIVAKDTGHYKVFALRDLLPEGFGPGNLASGPQTGS